MRLRLLLRRLTVSAPRMAVRSALPWPFRWAVLAIVAGFCAAIALWAFEFGKDIAGLDQGTKEQLQQAQAQIEMLRGQLDAMTLERNKAQSVAHTADTVLTTEKVAQEKMALLNKQLELDNQRLKDDLGFFEQLIPSVSTGANPGTLAIRGLQGEVLQSGELKWQVLVIQASKNPVELNGQLEITLAGLLDNKPWADAAPGLKQAIRIRQYGRLSGVYQLPARVLLKSLTVKVLEGGNVRAIQTLKL